MSLYNMLFGFNQQAPVLLACLGISAGDVPRFRDCFIEGENIVIHTRTGGGNRETYEAENDYLTQHACYLRDEDDDFDSTYANFYYKFPDEFAADLAALAAKNESHTTSQKWQALIAALEKPDAPVTPNAG